MAEKDKSVQNHILDAVDAGMIVLDADRRIVRWNAWMTSASGKGQEDVLGARLAEVFPRSNLARLDAAMTAAIKRGLSGLLTHALHAQLLPLRTRAGREMLHDVTVSSIPDGSDGKCLIHIVDVTMAVRRERYLRDRQKARYDAVVENAPDAILTLDADGIIRLANNATQFQFGYDHGELIGQPAACLFETKEIWQAAWHRVLEQAQLPHPVELTILCKDGSRGYFELSASRWKNDNHLHVTAILRDAGERRTAEMELRASEERARASAKALAELNATLEQRVTERTNQLLEAEEALRQSQKMEAIGQLTGGIAHDFNNLLQGILGALNMVSKRMAEGRISEIERFLHGAVSSAERASTLTHRLLTFSRRQPIAPKPIDVNALIGSIEELVRRSLGERVKMVISCADDLWLIRCDANQLENAILNLAINARDAMPDGGTLAISAVNASFDAAQALIRDLQAGDYVVLRIHDTGVGMAPDVQARAFDPFFTTKPLGKGTGLGLSMIYGFARQAAGSVRIKSEVGNGSTIELSLPRFDGNATVVLTEPLPVAEDGAGNNEVVLVAEDEEVVRLLVVEVLSDLGYRVLEAADGRAALRILQSTQKIDLFVTDIGLPEINGRQVVDAAREMRSSLKVLFMTGYAEVAADGQFLEKDMELISKPFTVDKLAAKIREMLSV
ncbi:PAS domain S-box protein [Paraburkholderia sp. DHOC27]|uniref:PAS domain S-box protein n=1 Tax=Paraburkholderia sp. DHOC27 TaxID=2303330 RepID=UPI000E3C3E24|nr:PAS domain S-box protein [Paraburkholderia sp. DHOC27]RFU44499.1 PAS domain S-box protein [Paraburkholderia sp. DHOC27]